MIRRKVNAHALPTFLKVARGAHPKEGGGLSKRNQFIALTHATTPAEEAHQWFCSNEAPLSTRCILQAHDTIEVLHMPRWRCCSSFFLGLLTWRELYWYLTHKIILSRKLEVQPRRTSPSLRGTCSSGWKTATTFRWCLVKEARRSENISAKERYTFSPLS